MNIMLKKRLITASILLPLVILGIVYLPIVYFSVISAVVFLLAAWEWTLLSGCQSIRERILGVFGMLLWIVLIALLLCGAIILWNHFPLDHLSFTTSVLFPLTILIWCLALLAIVVYPRYSRLYASKASSLLIGACILVPAFVFLILLEEVNPHYLLYVMCLIWSADTGAYFAGRRYGQHKLAERVSPGKTWEGVLGGVLLSLVVVSAGYSILEVPTPFFGWAMLGIITVLFSIVGDLFESLFKRLRNIKDSGTLLPGHGGILDRMDSLIAAVPIFIIGIELLG